MRDNDFASGTSSRDSAPSVALPLRCQRLLADGWIAGGAEPVRCGIPWPKGALEEVTDLRLRRADGTLGPVQCRVLDRWPDDSVRWMLTDWLAGPDANGGTYLENSPGPSAVQQEQIEIETSNSNEGEGAVHVDTGEIRIEVQVGAAFPFGSAVKQGQPVLDSERSGLWFEDDRGRRQRAIVDSLSVEDSGPLRITLVIGGHVQGTGSIASTSLLARMDLWAGSPAVRLEVTILNPHRAGHPRGHWSLGQKGSVFFRDASLVLALRPDPAPTQAYCSPEVGAPFDRVALPLEIYQDSSGGEHWDSSNHLNRKGELCSRFRGYRFRAADTETSGLRATPIVAIERGENLLAATSEHFWQNFPKAIEATHDTLRIGLFPRQYEDLHELQGGEQKTHVLFVAFGDDGVTDPPLAWCRSPSIAHVDPEWYADAEAVPFLRPRAEDPNTSYLELVDLAIVGDDTFGRKREVCDEYGWRNFGDLYADHETRFHQGSLPLISHYNNQYDAIQGFAIQFMRSGNPIWHRLMDDLARHYVDIDIYHTQEDKSAYNNGHFWHTTHYTDAGTSTHRSFPPSEGVVGGGPCGGHLYTSGLLLHYFLTGYPLSRNEVEAAGQFVVDADDGNQTIFRFLDRSPTGVVSVSGDGSYHGPGRNPGNSIYALLEADRVAPDRGFLEQAETLIRRCIHPLDDLQARNLLDAENRWYYTMFLQCLGKYLGRKLELDQRDASYAYGRAALLHYALWAAEHEYPYLEKPEILEFPTETWAAQDMRKSEVFRLAAMHADPTERDLLLERARFFFDSSTQQLGKHPTRSYSRPVVLMLSLGHAQCFFDKYPKTTAPQALGDHDFGEPEEFVSQKQRAKQKLKHLALLGLGLGSAALAAAAWMWMGHPDGR